MKTRSCAVGEISASRLRKRSPVTRFPKTRMKGAALCEGFGRFLRLPQRLGINHFGLLIPKQRAPLQASKIRAVSPWMRSAREMEMRISRIGLVQLLAMVLFLSAASPASAGFFGNFFGGGTCGPIRQALGWCGGSGGSTTGGSTTGGSTTTGGGSTGGSDTSDDSDTDTSDDSDIDTSDTENGDAGVSDTGGTDSGGTDTGDSDSGDNGAGDSDGGDSDNGDTGGSDDSDSNDDSSSSSGGSGGSGSGTSGSSTADNAIKSFTVSNDGGSYAIGISGVGRVNSQRY